MRPFVLTLTAAATLGAGAFAQQSTPLPAEFSSFGPSCGAMLTGRDKIVGGRHQLTLDHTSAGPARIVVVIVGLQRTQLPIPGTACLMHTLPIVSAPMAPVAPGFASSTWTFPFDGHGDHVYFSVELDPALGLSGSNGLEASFSGRMTIDSVSPGYGKEGDLIVIRGSGFDPNPRNQCVLIAGTTAATVLQATPNKLVARVGAIPAPAAGDVCVLRGKGSSLPTGAMKLAGQQVIVRQADHLAGNVGLNAGVKFVASQASRNTAGGVFRQGAIRFAPVPTPVLPGGELDLVLHICDPTLPPPECGEAHMNFEPVSTLTPAQAEQVLADYVSRFVPDMTASATPNGLVVSPTRRGSPEGLGVIRVK